MPDNTVSLYVAAIKLNVRDAPGLKSNIIGSVQTGLPLTVSTTEVVPADGFTWVKIVDGPFAGTWIAHEFMSATQPQPRGAPTVPDQPQPSSPPVPIPPVSPPLITPIRIGLHIGPFRYHNEILAMAKRLHDAGKPLAVCKVISDPDFANQLAPYTTVLFRQVWDGRERLNLAEFPYNEADAITYGRAKYNGEHKGPNDAARAAHFLQFTNELGGSHPFDYAVALGLMMEADQHGRKVAIFGDSTGTPEPDQWQRRIPALRYAMANGHAVVLNEYGPWKDGQPSGIPVSTADGFEVNGGRHRKLYASVPPDCRPKLIIGETGPSDATFRGPDALAADMRAYNQLLQTEDYVLGFCWFTAGQSFQNPAWEINAGLGAIEQLAMQL